MCKLQVHLVESEVTHLGRRGAPDGESPARQTEVLWENPMQQTDT